MTVVSMMKNVEDTEEKMLRAGMEERKKEKKRRRKNILTKKHTQMNRSLLHVQAEKIWGSCLAPLVGKKRTEGIDRVPGDHEAVSGHEVGNLFNK